MHKPHIATCFVTLTVGWAFFTASQGATLPMREAKGRPGEYRALENTNDNACRYFAKIVNSSISKSGDLDFSRLESKMVWAELNPPLSDPPTKVATFDIDNDGKLDRIFRVDWSIGNKYTTELYIHRSADLSQPPPSERQAVLEIVRTAPAVGGFNSSVELNRVRARYPDQMEAWYMGKHVVIDALSFAGQNYLIAFHYGVRPNNWAAAYVFQVAPDASIVDVCMLGRVCPCGGCTGRETSMEQRLHPDPKYCSANTEKKR